MQCAFWLYFYWSKTANGNISEKWTDNLHSNWTSNSKHFYISRVCSHKWHSLWIEFYAIYEYYYAIIVSSIKYIDIRYAMLRLFLFLCSICYVHICYVCYLYAFSCAICICHILYATFNMQYCIIICNMLYSRVNRTLLYTEWINST